MTQANKSLTYCAGCGRLIPGSEMQAGLSEARDNGVICINCIERADPRRAAEIRELSFREAERAKVSVQLMWAPPGVIPPRAARLAGEASAAALAPGAVDPISGDIGVEPPAGNAAAGPAGGILLQGSSQRRVPWWVIGVASLLMSVLGAVTQRLIMRAQTEPPGPSAPVTAPALVALNPQPQPVETPRTIEITPRPNIPAPPPPDLTTPTPPPPPVPPSPTEPGTFPPGPTPTTPAPRPAPSAEDEARAQALLASADADFETVPDRAEKLYATILDFYPTTAAATLARLRQTDLAAARDRADVALLQVTFDHARATALPETYWESIAALQRITALKPHGAQSSALQPRLAAQLQDQLNLVKNDLAARAPLIVGACIDNNELARAAAIVQTIDRFGDPANHALAQALQPKIDTALAMETFKKQAPALKATLACAPYISNFDARLIKWDFTGAARELLPTGSEDLWKNAGPDSQATARAVADYFQNRFRDALIKRAQAAALAKAEFQLDWTGVRPEPAGGNSWALQRSREIHTGPLTRVNTDGLTVIEQGRELRVDWPRLSAASLRLIAQYAPPDDAAPASDAAADAAEAERVMLAGALQALALARGEITATECTATRDPWRAFFALRLQLESDTQGTRTALALRQALDANDVLQTLYADQAYQTFARTYPPPLAFLSPEGRGLVMETKTFLTAKKAGRLQFYQNYQQPDRLYDGIKFEALAERADQRPSSGQFLAGARGGTQRVLVRFENVKIPAGERVQKAFLRLPVLAAITSRTDTRPVQIDGLLGLAPLPAAFNTGHVTWEFCDTLHSTRWPFSGAFSSDGPEPTPGKRVTPTGDELLFDITPYFDQLAKTDYTDPGHGLLLKVLKNEPDYTITLPDPATAVLATSPAPRLELQVVAKDYNK